jgi:hypothetical protein
MSWLLVSMSGGCGEYVGGRYVRRKCDAREEIKIQRWNQKPVNDS